MKYYVALSALLFVLSPAFAQVNLDQPLSVTNNDMVYRSTADGQSAYFIPAVLRVLASPRISEINGEYHANFEVGMDQGMYQAISEKVKAFMGSENKPLELRMMRGWNASMDPKGSVDTPPKFKPRLEPLGDPGNLGASLPYMFAVKKIGPKQGKESQALLKDLFTSSAPGRHLGTIFYEFNAIKEGKPWQAQSAVGIFALDLGDLTMPNLKSLNPVTILSAVNEDPAAAIKTEILLDSEKSCWNQIEAGQICLK